MTAVEKPRVAGVLHARQDLSLAREAAEDLGGIHAALDELHRDPLFEPAVGALAEMTSPMSPRPRGSIKR